MRKRNKTPIALVTGAGGCAGSSLCRHLVEKGYYVKAFVRPGSSLAALENIAVKIVEGDISRDDGLEPQDFSNVNTVFHLAALPKHTNASHDEFQNVNVEGTRRVLECAHQAGATRFVHCSSAGVHAEADNTMPANENTPFQSNDWYHETKRKGEQLALQWGQEHDLAVTVIRPSSICGSGNMRLLKLFRAIQHKYFTMIGNGKNHYHLVHADDLAKAFIQAAENPEAINEAFIIAGTWTISLDLYVEYVCDALGTSKPLLRLPAAPVMLTARICAKICKHLNVPPPLSPQKLDFFTKNRAFDCSKAKTILGYEPEVTPAESITRVVAWCRQNSLL